MRRFESADCVRLRPPGGDPIVTWVAAGVSLRLVGLVLLPALGAGQALLLPRCRSVHTFGMRFALDVAFVTWPPDPDVEVLAVRAEVSPGRLVVTGGRKARRVAALEAVSASLRCRGVAAGARLSIDSAWDVSERRPGVHGPV